MSKKIIFFDVDGTLVDVRPVKEMIPESTIQAVRETRSKGNLCYLCTGRSLAEIYPQILDVGFDGIIGAGGGNAKEGLKAIADEVCDDIANDGIYKKQGRQEIVLIRRLITISLPPVAPYVRVSYTALHLHDNFRLT